jgi:hypothetical protein
MKAFEDENEKREEEKSQNLKIFFAFFGNFLIFFEVASWLHVFWSKNILPTDICSTYKKFEKSFVDQIKVAQMTTSMKCLNRRSVKRFSTNRRGTFNSWKIDDQNSRQPLFPIHRFFVVRSKVNRRKKLWPKMSGRIFVKPFTINLWSVLGFWRLNYKKLT